jgi:superfamily II DNA or RNA helicase
VARLAWYNGARVSYTCDDRRVPARLPGVCFAGCHADKVPINEYQQRAVRDLRGGLDIIHGPPGTGKSTIVFHIINSRVQEDKQVLASLATAIACKQAPGCWYGPCNGMSAKYDACLPVC